MRSLQEICLDRVSRLLKKGTWNRCVKNPFSSMSTNVIDTLMEFLLSRPVFNTTKDMRLLFQSGQLSRLELSTLLVDDDRKLLLKWMTEEVCKNLRVLSVLYTLGGENGTRVVRDLIQRCHNLEEFHSKVVIRLNELSHCHQLKNLRLHLHGPPHNVVSEEFLQTITDFVQSKPNLEVLSFCNLKDNSKIAYQAIATSLGKCPKLISVGFIDCLEALFQLRKSGSLKKLNLKRCLWGPDEGDDPKSSEYRRKYPDMVENAVHMCPVVDTLVINVYNEAALEHLVHLKHLRSLSLKFIYSSADNATILIFLLRRIGPSLEHLSLDMKGETSIPVEAIRDHCFNLKSLQIHGEIAMKDDMEDCLSPLQLERLYIWKADSRSLLLLLRNSPKLIELYLGKVPCLDEELTVKILMDDFMFRTLTVVGIKECLLTETAMSKFLNSALNLKELFFGSTEMYKLAHKAIVQEKLKVLHYYDNFKLYKREYYIFRPDRCSF